MKNIQVKKYSDMTYSELTVEFQRLKEIHKELLRELRKRDASVKIKTDNQKGNYP